MPEIESKRGLILSQSLKSHLHEKHIFKHIIDRTTKRRRNYLIQEKGNTYEKNIPKQNNYMFEDAEVCYNASAKNENLFEKEIPLE